MCYDENSDQFNLPELYIQTILTFIISCVNESPLWLNNHS